MIRRFPANSLRGQLSPRAVKMGTGIENPVVAASAAAEAGRRAALAQVSKTRQVGPEVGPTSAFPSCIPKGRHGQSCIFWANLKSTFSLEIQSGIEQYHFDGEEQHLSRYAS